MAWKLPNFSGKQARLD